MLRLVLRLFFSFDKLISSPSYSSSSLSRLSFLRGVDSTDDAKDDEDGDEVSLG